MKATSDHKPKLRFSDFSNVPNWSERKLGDLFGERVSKGHPEKPVLSASQDRGVIPYSLLDKSVVRDKQNLSGYKLVKPGDFVISLRSFEGGFEYSRYEGIISPAYVVLERKEEINDAFFQLLFKSDPFISAIRNKLNNNLRDGKSISYNQAKSVLVFIPYLDEQKKIADCLSSLGDYIESQSRMLSILKLQKRGLMQKLFAVSETR